MMQVRTSLARAPSSYTPEQLAASLGDYEREIFERHRAVVVWLDKPRGLPRLVTMALEAWGQARFGKRKGKAT